MSSLYLHQKEALDTIKQYEKTYNAIKGVILAFKMGMGKTRTMLELLHNDLDKKKFPNLVVCNKSNVKVWNDEITKYKDIYPNFKAFIYHKDYNNLDTSLTEILQHNIIITTYEVIRENFKKADPACFKIRINNFYEPLPGLYSLKQTPEHYTIYEVMKPMANPKEYNIFYSNVWNRIIADESQRFSGYNTILFKSMTSLRAKHYYCLSGTPIVNYGIDLYTQFKFMGLELIPKDWNAQYYEDSNLKRYIISKTFKDTDIKLTECNMIDIKITLSETEKKMYNEVIIMLKNKYNEFKRGTETFAAPLAMLTRLRQICVCPYTITADSKKPSASKIKCPIPDRIIHLLIEYLDNQMFANLLRAYPSLYKLFKGKIWKEKIQMLQLMPTQFFSDPKLNIDLNDKTIISHWTKLRKCLKIIKRNMKFNKKIVVFSSFVSFLNILNEKIVRKKIGKVLQIDGSTKERDKIVDKFTMNPKYNILLCSYKTGGVGINLTAAESMILVEPWWSSAVEQQAICRIHRIGQEKPVNIYSLIVDKSVEMHMLNIQLVKKKEIKKYGLKSGGYSRVSNGGAITREVIEKVVYSDPLE